MTANNIIVGDGGYRKKNSWIWILLLILVSGIFIYSYFDIDSFIARTGKIKIDTVYKVVEIERVIIETKEVPKPIYIYKKDSSEVVELIGLIDSLEAELRKRKVERYALLDTIYKPTLDTFFLQYGIINNEWLVDIRYSKREIPVAIETIYVPMLPNERVQGTKWYEKPQYTITGGLILGIIIGLGTGNSK